MNLEHYFTVSITAHSISMHCHSSKCPLLAPTQARRRAVHQLRYQLQSEIRAKCPTVSQLRELVTRTHTAGQAINK